MQLENAGQAYVEREKITGYLLSADHRYGAHKARFFSEFGFRSETWSVLAEALRDHGQRHAVANIKKTDFGTRYEVDGPLETPTGQRPQIRTVWQIDLGENAPRLITAYPLERRT
jgi:hypothetical protein